MCEIFVETNDEMLEKNHLISVENVITACKLLRRLKNLIQLWDLESVKESVKNESLLRPLKSF